MKTSPNRSENLSSNLVCVAKEEDTRADERRDVSGVVHLSLAAKGVQERYGATIQTQVARFEAILQLLEGDPHSDVRSFVRDRQDDGLMMTKT